MKNAKRIAIVILSLLLVATCALLVLSACDGNGYKVTLNYDSTKGIVTVSEPAAGSKYEKGETVMVLVAPASGYKVGDFSVTGHSDAALVNGQYTFDIQSNTTVSVTFEELTGNYYTVTVNCDEGATVTLSPQPENGNKYQEGTLVTATLQLQSGYEVGTCYVDNAIVRFVDNKITFTVLHDTLVEVAAYRPIPASVLQSLRGNVLFGGDVYKVNASLNNNGVAGDPTTRLLYQFISMYDADKQLVWQWEDGEEGTFSMVFGSDEQGYVAMPTHGYDGVFEWLRMSDSEGNYLPFSSYYNPFEYLNAADFIYEEDNHIGEDVYDSVWSLSPNNAQNVLYAITGYTYDVATFKIGVLDGVAAEIVFVTTETRTNVRVSYTVGEFGIQQDTSEYALDDDILAPEYPEQEELEKALADAAAVTSYKVQHSYTNGINTGYDIYREGDVVWITGDDYSYGYLIRPDEMVWEFSFKDGQMVLSNNAVTDDIMNVVATFDLMGVSPSMFKHVGNGRYVLRDCDLNGYYAQDLVYYSALSFATGADEQTEFYYYASNVAITLDSNGVLSKVEVYYYVADADNKPVEYAIVLDFSEFGTAKIPSDVEIDEDVYNGIIPVEYLGVWLYDDTGMRVDVALDTITIDGVVSTSITKTADKAFTIVIDGQERYLTVNENGALVLDGTKVLRFRECAWEDMIGTYDGTSYWESNGYQFTDVLHMVIKEDGIEFTIGDGTESFAYKLTKADFTFTEFNGEAMIKFYFTDYYYGDCTAYVTLLAKKQVINFYVLDESGYYWIYDVNAYVDGYNHKDWSMFIGEYADGDNTLKIEADKITINYNGKEIVFTADEITYYAVEYVVPMFNMTRGETVYELQQYGGTNCKLRLYIGDDTAATFVNKEDYEMASWAKYIGEYAGDYTNEDDETTVAYRVEITADGVKLWIDGVEKAVTVDDFDIYIFVDSSTGNRIKLYSFSLTCVDGDKTVHYSLRQGNVGVFNTWVLTCDEDDELFVVLELVTDTDAD